MKKLFLVLGSNSGDAAAWTSNLRPSKDKHNGIVVFASEITNHKALEKTLKAIRVCGDSDYNNMVVAYFGDNLHLLKANLPCPSLDLYLLVEKLKEAIGGFDSPRNKKLVLDLLTGGLQRFLTEDEAPLVGDEREVWTYSHSE